MKEILDRILTEEEEGGEIFRFNDLVFRLAGRTEGKRQRDRRTDNDCQN